MGGPNVEMNMKEVKFGGMDWIDVAQVRNQWQALANQ
jgi:hypothetical protein